MPFKSAVKPPYSRMSAQMLVAISAAAELGYAVSAFQIIPFLFYPFLLLASSLVFIFLVPDKRGRESEKA